jgi:hypothetical protein
MSAWRDAPLFPTPQGILDGLDKIAPLTCTDRILDAGCGLGAGLAELYRIYPQAHLEGLEKSWVLAHPVRMALPLCPGAPRDIWKEDWSAYSMVYMFQRPESMGPAVEKARRELLKGSWLVSLEFEAPLLTPFAVLRNQGGQARLGLPHGLKPPGLGFLQTAKGMDSRLRGNDEPLVAPFPNLCGPDGNPLRSLPFHLDAIPAHVCPAWPDANPPPSPHFLHWPQKRTNPRCIGNGGLCVIF